MSYIVRSGTVAASTALLGESGRHSAYLTVDSPDTGSSRTRFSVQVFGATAEHIVRIIKNGHSPNVIFAGRLTVSETQTPEGLIPIWSVGAEYLGISVDDEFLTSE